MIREMREKGMSISEIARQMHISRNTVKKHLRLDKPLEYKRKGRKSKLDPVKPIIKVLIDFIALNKISNCGKSSKRARMIDWHYMNIFLDHTIVQYFLDSLENANH